jgi:5-hydroxyisourate hydrolase-like protein (transthyretin family)
MDMARLRSTLLFALALTAALVMAGCGLLDNGAPPQPDPDPPGNGVSTHRTSVAITTSSTPKSATATSASSLMVEYDRVDLVRADGGGVVTVSYEPGSVDLMTLHGGDLALLGEADIPHGTYNQIRLRVVAAWISFDGGATSYPVKVPSGALSGLKINVHPFLEANAEGVSALVLDFNAGSSIVETPPGSNNFLLKPTSLRAVSAYGDLTGTVIDAESAEPIEGATVEVRTPGGDELVTSKSSEADGSFWFTFLAAGQYELHVYADGYEAAEVHDVTVEIDHNTDVGAIELEPIADPETGTLFGVTADIETFLPIEGALVELSLEGESEVVASADTDALGRFKVEDLEEGTYDVTFSAAGYQSLTIVGVFAAAGAMIDMGDVLLTPDTVAEPGDLTGTVLDADTLFAIEGALVEVHVHGEAGLVANAFTEADGTFSIEGLPEGSYDLAFSADGYEPHLLTEVMVDAGGLTDVGEVLLTPIGSEESDPADGWIIGLVADIETLAVLPGAEIEVFVHGETEVIATTSSGPMGRFLVGELAEGSYDLVITLDGYVPYTMSNVFVPEGAIRAVGDALLTPAGGAAD